MPNRTDTHRPAAAPAFVKIILIAATLIGAIAFTTMMLGGAARAQWGYVAATIAFVLSAAQLSPALALTSRLSRAVWAAPLRRIADVLALGGIATAPALLVLQAQLPAWSGRPSIWFDWPGAPQLYDGVAAVALALTGAAVVAVSLGGDRPKALRQWRILTGALVALGSFYVMLAVFVHLLICSDLLLSLVPGWHSAVIPAYHVVSAFEAAIALIAVILAVVGPTHRETFHAMGKLLLAMALLWFYFVWCELLTNWYGRTPDEQSVLALFMFGPTAPLFAIAALCEFVLPVLVLIWSSARGSVATVTVVAVFVLVGSFADRLRLFVPAWSVATDVPTEHLPEPLPPIAWPGLAEVLASAGVIALVALIVVTIAERVPLTDTWETRAAHRLTPERRMLRTRVSVVGRPS